MDRKQELRQRAEKIVSQRRQEEELRRLGREEKEAKEVELIREEKRKARELVSLKERDRSVKNQVGVDLIRKQLLMAKTFYNKQLLIKYGLCPFRMLLDLATMNENKAAIFYADLLIRKFWCLLYGYCHVLRLERYRKEQRRTATATAHYSSRLLRSILRFWKQHRKVVRAKAIAVSGQSNVFSKKKRAFGAWIIAFDKEKRMCAKKMRQVSGRGNACVKRFFWRRWEEHVRSERLEREVRVRSKNTWEKVKGWLAEKG